MAYKLPMENRPLTMILWRFGRRRFQTTLMGNTKHAISTLTPTKPIANADIWRSTARLVLMHLLRIKTGRFHVLNSGVHINTAGSMVAGHTRQLITWTAMMTLLVFVSEGPMNDLMKQRMLKRVRNMPVSMVMPRTYCTTYHWRISAGVQS